MTDDLTRWARDEAERRYPTEVAATEGFIAGAEWAVSELPIPADDDAPCPRCGCPTACPEGRAEALSAELAEAKAEIERLRAGCYRAWDVAVEERLRRLEVQAGIESPPEPGPDPLAGRLPLQVEYGLVWDDLGSADMFPTLEQARAAARGFDEPAQVVRIETWPVADEVERALLDDDEREGGEE
jgi:hypothetical protein